MSKRSELTVAQRREVVLKMLRREDTVSALARAYGVSENTLYRWRDEFLAAGETALSDGRGKDPRAEELKRLKKQLAQRDQVIGELTIANRILKKMEDGLL